MKTEKKGVEGQLDIFEAMNRAADAIDRMVEEDQKKKKTSGNKTESGEKSAKAVTGQKKNKEDKIIRGCDMLASMQKTFLNPEDGDFAMIAYIDYNKVYIREWNSPAALYTFEESKKAVDFYIDKLTKIKAAGIAEETTEQEPFSDVKYLSDNIYAECEE